MKKIILTICLFVAFAITAQKTYDFTAGNAVPWIKAGNAISADQSSDGLTFEFNAGNPRLDITAGADPFDASTLTHLIVTLVNNSSEVGTMSGFTHKNDGDANAGDGTQFLGFNTQISSGLGTYVIDLTSANYNNDEADMGGTDDPDVIKGNDTDGIANMEYVGIRFRNAAGAVLTGSSAVNGNIIIKKIEIVAEGATEKLHYNFNTEGVSTWSNQSGTTVTDGGTTLDIALGTTTNSRVQETFYMQDPANATNVHIFIESNTSGYDEIKFQYTKDTDPSSYKTSGAKSATAGVVSYSLTNAEWVTTTNGVKKIIRLQFSASGTESAGIIKISRILFNNSNTINNWKGTNTSWSDTSNWSKESLPTATEEVFISSKSNNPIIDATTGAEALNLTVESNAALTITGGGSLIVSGTSTGDVTYNRTLTSKPANADGWHLVSSPVDGEVFDNDYATANSIASGSGSNLGIATYNNDWTYLQSPAGSISSTSGIGYSMKRSADGTVGFTGTINTADVNGVAVSASATDFVLLGVPYTAYMSSADFLTANANLDQSQIWVWEQGTTGGNYIANTAKADNFILAPGQGFFVKKANTDATVNFAESNQQSNADTFKKSSRTEVKLLVNDGKIERFAKMYYLNNVTKGYDVGYEGETFEGVETSFDVFSHLVEDNQGKNYQVQSLPLTEMESTIVSLGLKVASEQEITISAETLNLPSGIKVFLEDRTNNTFTRLDQANTSYKVKIVAGTSEGRFFLHTNSGALSTDSEFLNTISIYRSNATTLRIVGLSQGETSVKLFNLLGKQVMNSSFNTTGVKELTLPNVATGVYIVQLETEAGKLNKKIVLE
jgi:hypothetical protein